MTPLLAKARECYFFHKQCPRNQQLFEVFARHGVNAWSRCVGDAASRVLERNLIFAATQLI